MPETHIVKAFTIYGFENFENNSYPGYGIKPVMMYCGKDKDAKKTVGGLISQLGWARCMSAASSKPCISNT